MNTEEAVKIVMEELGWWPQPSAQKWYQRKGKEDSMEWKAPEQAFAHCKDLNVLAGIWSKETCYVTFCFEQGKVTVDGAEAGVSRIKKIRTIQDAALIATAEALQTIKVKR